MCSVPITRYKQHIRRFESTELLSRVRVALLLRCVCQLSLSFISFNSNSSEKHPILPLKCYLKSHTLTNPIRCLEIARE